MTVPLFPFTVENRLAASMDGAGSMVGRASDRGLMFYPIQNRAWLVRKMVHPAYSGLNERGVGVTLHQSSSVISNADNALNARLLPLRRSAALDHPQPLISMQFENGLPRLRQPLPTIPRDEELRHVVQFSGYGGGQDGDDVPWSDDQRRDYLHSQRTTGGEAETARWNCQTCYNKAKGVGLHGDAAARAACAADRHRVTDTTVESARDAAEFQAGMKLMARVHGLSERHLVGVNIGSVPRPGGGRMGDVMPHWARVVQMIQALEAYQGPPPVRGAASSQPRREPLTFVAMASHGWTDGTQLGLTMSPSDNEMAYRYTQLFLRTLASMCHPDVSIIIYGCSAGGESKSFGSRSIGRWIADELRGYGVLRPRVDAHTVVGHSFKAPWIRRFEPHLAHGGAGGVWIVPPTSVTHAQQVRGESSEVSKLKGERLRTYRQRALRAVNHARRRTIARRNRPATFLVADYQELAQLEEQGFALQRRALNQRVPAAEADQAFRAAIQKYREAILRFEQLLVERGVSPSRAMVEVLELTHMDTGNHSEPQPAVNQASEADGRRWLRWQRSLQLGLDGLNFCAPMISRHEASMYIDGLPQGDNLEQTLLDTPGSQHFWFYSEVYAPPPPPGQNQTMIAAPEGEYFGTIPEAYTPSSRRRARSSR
jgi:hypothetical protein